MPPRPTGRLVPSHGSLFGIHTIPDSPTAKTAADMGITKREADAGRTLDIDNHYYPNFDAAAPLSGGKPTLPGWREQWDIQSGRIPMVSWGGADVIEIVNGKYDAAIDAAATRLQALGAPFFLRWFWEPDGTRASKASLSHTPQDYIKAWRYIHDRFAKDGNTNAVWVWCPVSLDFYPPSGQTSTDPTLAPNHAINPVGAQPYYPGDDVVDWMCADGYDWAPNKPGTRYESFQELFQAFYNWSVPHNKPLMVGETGVQENNPGDKAKWINAMHLSLTQHYPNIVAFDYFDTKNANGLDNEWWLESSPDAYQAWKDMAADPYFNVKSTLAEAPYGGGASVSPPPPVSGPPPGTGTTTTTTTTPSGPSVGPSTGPDHVASVPDGYWMLGADGKVYPFGSARATGDGPPGVDAVDLEPTPSGRGYWILSADGRVTPTGDATALGNVDISRLAPGEHVTSLSATPTGKGYWVFTSRGRAVAFGDATFLGDVSRLTLNGPVLGSVATPSGKGYYMVASDGGIFAFGDAHFAGSMGGKRLNAPVESLVPDADGEGYWLVASDGGIFAFDAPFKGSMGGTRLARPVTGMVRYGDGYLMVAEDGGIFDFSSSPFAGSLGGHPPARPIVAVAAL
jgi:ribosomal protein L24E